MKEFLKKNKYILLIVFAFLILLIIMFIAMKDLFFSTGKDKYGERLEGIEEYVIDDDRQADLINSLKEKDKVNDVSVDIKGKIIHVIIDVKNETSLKDAKSFASLALEKFTEEELSFYDVQFYLTQNENESEESSYPVMGSKSALNDFISWIKE